MKIILKSFALIAFLAVLTAPFQVAAQGGHHVNYTATMSGIDCNGCKKTIAVSLGKIKGVETVKIVKQSEGVHRLTVITDGSTPISKDRARRAVQRSDHYKLLSWSKY